jgi:8-amino-7-oxononanoate synthase
MQNLAAALSLRKQQQLYRSRHTVEGPQDVLIRIDGRQYLSFCSNDYLGLASHPRLVDAFKEGVERFGVGSGAAHLVTGHSYAHQTLEEDLADFTGRPRVLLFSTGYMANLGLVSALTGHGDTVFEDRLNHASLIDAALLSGAKLQRYRHGDIDNLNSKMLNIERGVRLVASDGVFSMDGDCAPVAELAKLSVEKNAWLLVDEAHAIGVIGRQGRGWFLEQLSEVPDSALMMATLGKAFGTFGAFVAGTEDLIETLIQRARTYVYTTAPPPALAWATRTALQLVREGDELRDRLSGLVRRFREGAEELGLPIMASETPIQPLVVGGTGVALRLSEALFAHDILVTAIRPPTVPEGKARLRVTFSARHQPAQVDRLLEVLSSCYREISDVEC